MKSKSIITVKEWIFDRINDNCKNYNCSLVYEYMIEDGFEVVDHSKIRVEEVIGESEKAWHVLLDAETFNGRSKLWNCWIPKSAIIVVA